VYKYVKERADLLQQIENIMIYFLELCSKINAENQL